MIPKTLHYCWFGRGEKPASVREYLDTWKIHCPEYAIKEWNEDNFDLDLYPYTREAYAARKYAFVTDVVRLYALYTEGGIYMDTDVEVLKPLDVFLQHKAFSGYEGDSYIPTGIMGAEKGSTWAKAMLEDYDGLHFLKPDGTYDLTTNVERITQRMKQRGLRGDNTFQEFSDFTLYPKDYFCPKSYKSFAIESTERTHTIHHFSGTWLPAETQQSHYREKCLKLIAYTPSKQLAQTWQKEVDATRLANATSDHSDWKTPYIRLALQGKLVTAKRLYALRALVKWYYKHMR